MFDPKSQKQPKANVVGAEKSSLALVTAPDARPPEDTAKISARAYELYEGRGCEPGQDQQDWLRAELEILKP